MCGMRENQSDVVEVHVLVDVALRLTESCDHHSERMCEGEENKKWKCAWDGAGNVRSLKSYKDEQTMKLWQALVRKMYTDKYKEYYLEGVP